MKLNIINQFLMVALEILIIYHQNAFAAEDTPHLEDQKSPTTSAVSLDHCEDIPQELIEYNDLKHVFFGTSLEPLILKENINVLWISSLKGLAQYIENNSHKFELGNSPGSIVFDIDYTLVDKANGGESIEHSELIESTLKDTLDLLELSGFSIFFVSGRDPKHTDATIDFFNQQGIRCDHDTLKCIGARGNKGDTIKDLCPSGSLFFIDDQLTYLAQVLETQEFSDREIVLCSYREPAKENIEILQCVYQ